MSTNTSFYDFVKQALTDYYNREIDNTNLDLIDAALRPTADPAQVPTGNVGKLSQWVSWIANRIKAITGADHWYDDPLISLNDADLAIEAEATARANADTELGGLISTVSGDVDSLDTRVTTLEGSSAVEQVLLRDILKMKMRQTGLNLDPNAWSDTLEDVSGINTGASSNYTYDSVNKSLKVGYNLLNPSFESVTANIPDNWTFEQSAEHAGNTYNAYTAWKTDGLQSYFMTAQYASDFTSAYYLQIKRTLDFSNIDNILIDVKTSATNGTGGGKTEILVGTTSVWNSTTANTVYNLNLDVSAFTGSQDLILKVSVPAGAIAKQGGAYFDNVRITGHIEAIVIWNSVTSTGTLIKSIVEAIQTLGTGTITYYVSRDGGTTYTQCTLDTITDIFAQPSGTSIVLKAVITGNAELFAVAWGGVA